MAQSKQRGIPFESVVRFEPNRHIIHHTYCIRLISFYKVKYLFKFSKFLVYFHAKQKISCQEAIFLFLFCFIVSTHIFCLSFSFFTHAHLSTNWVFAKKKPIFLSSNILHECKYSLTEGLNGKIVRIFPSDRM